MSKLLMEKMAGYYEDMYPFSHPAPKRRLLGLLKPSKKQVKKYNTEKKMYDYEAQEFNKQVDEDAKKYKMHPDQASEALHKKISHFNSDVFHVGGMSDEDFQTILRIQKNNLNKKPSTSNRKVRDEDIETLKNPINPMWKNPKNWNTYDVNGNYWFD